MENTDKQVMDLYDIVQNKKKEIAKAEKPNWLTNCSFGFGQDSNVRVNIQTVADPNKMVELLAFLYVQRNAFEEAAKDLGVKATFKWFGFSVEDWKQDFQTRLNKILISKKIGRASCRERV